MDFKHTAEAGAPDYNDDRVFGMPQNNVSVNRPLQMSALLVSLYALGVLNDVSATWQSRTYSSHVSRICGQVRIVQKAVDKKNTILRCVTLVIMRCV